MRESEVTALKRASDIIGSEFKMGYKLMTMQDLLNEIEQLPLEEQLAVLEALSRHIRRSLEQRPRRNLRGILATDAEPPTDDEIKDDYADYLIKKYS